MEICNASRYFAKPKHKEVTIKTKTLKEKIIRINFYKLELDTEIRIIKKITN